MEKRRHGSYHFNEFHTLKSFRTEKCVYITPLNFANGYLAMFQTICTWMVFYYLQMDFQCHWKQSPSECHFKCMQYVVVVCVKCVDIVENSFHPKWEIESNSAKAKKRYVNYSWQTMATAIVAELINIYVCMLHIYVYVVNEAGWSYLKVSVFNRNVIWKQQMTAYGWMSDELAHLKKNNCCHFRKTLKIHFKLGSEHPSWSWVVNKSVDNVITEF